MTIAVERRNARRRFRSSRSIGDFFVPGILILGLIAVWEIVVRLLDTPRVILPAPSLVATTMGEEYMLLLDNLRVTLIEVALGFALGLALGCLTGIAISYSRTVERALYPIVIASQVVPVFAIAPLLVIWFGFGITPKVLIAALIVFFPITVNQVDGIRSADLQVIRLMRSYSASRWDTFRIVQFPASLPYLIAGAKIGIAYSVIGAVIAEWVGAQEGIGKLMLAANSLSRTDLVFAAIIVLGIVGILLFWLVGVIGRLITPWQRVTSE